MTIREQLARRVRTRGIVTDVLVIAGATALCRVFGLFRDVVIANRFGASAAYDAYLIAFFVPNMLRQLLAEGALSTAFVPIYTGYLAEDRAEADRFASVTLSLAMLAFPLVIGLGIYLTPGYVPFLASGFAPEKLRLAISLTRITLPFIGLVGLAAIFMGILNGQRRFLAPALAPVLFDLGLIVGAWPLAAHLAQSSYGLAFGLLLGGLGMLLFQLAFLRGKVRFTFKLALHHEGLRQLARMMVPAVVGLAGVQVSLLVDNKLASHLGDGAISSLQYAIRLFQLPLGVFAISIANALLPRFSHRAAREDLAGLTKTLQRGILLGAFILFPATAGLYAIGRPTIRLLFEHGQFLPQDTTRTLAALNFYLIGLAAYGLVYLLTRAFYALRDTRTPVLLGLVGVAVNVVLDYALCRPLGVRGLALATSIAGLVNMALLARALQRRLGTGLIGPLRAELAKMALGAALMGGLAFLFYRGLAMAVESRFLLVALPALLGLTAYYLLAQLGGFFRVVRDGWAGD
ncbi:MAG: murein biosynthesis integral membrane protein MurJ [Candidatus Acetothermia bacterium]|jgi:putative peptidoglycan lipid II flippase|nr:murein biosynthesis integral membrane protein MurJ [Candidatus Acetothermia bacterium]MDH7505602.1 murein biosynthesis integral membrane protein MurJ [Candidatus Acetothermia bacterium]